MGIQSWTPTDRQHLASMLLDFRQEKVTPIRAMRAVEIEEMVRGRVSFAFIRGVILGLSIGCILTAVILALSLR